MKCIICELDLYKTNTFTNGDFALECQSTCRHSNKNNKKSPYYTHIMSNDSNKCILYSYPFHVKDKFYRITGSSTTCTFLREALYANDESPGSDRELTLIAVDYIDLSLDDDTHIKAKQIFERLYKLIPFI